MTKNILIVGVGGQGTLLTGRVIGNYAMSKGHDVKMSEVHGMAQRGGSVVMQVKYGTKVYSPLVDLGEADVIFAFEQMEALRYIQYLKEDGMVIANTQKIDPMPVTMGLAKYPDNIIEQIKDKCQHTCFIDALTKAKELGNIKVVNMIMIGAYAAYVGDSMEEWEVIVEQTVPKHTVDINKRALAIGYQAFLNR